MKTSKISAFLLILACAGSTVRAFLSVSSDHELIKEKCYEQGALFRPDVPPPSLDTFLQIVEKLEDKIDGPDRIIAMLLKRFSFQDLFVLNGQMKQDTLNLNDYVINKILKLTAEDAFEILPEGVLSDEELCGLFAMLSHSWNGTEHQDSLYNQQPDTVLRHYPAKKRYLMTTLKSRSEITAKISGSTTPQMMMYGPREHEKAVMPREMGVVAIHPGVTDEAVDLARVLLGIYHSLVYKDPVVSCDELYKRINPEAAEERDPQALTECNVLGLLTLGEALYRDTLVTDPVRPDGDWMTEAGCIRHHHLKQYPEGSTMAQIKGALDGFILGNQIKDWIDPLSKHLLSKALRTYYSLPKLDVPDAASVCNRDKLGDSLVKLSEDEVGDFVKTFIKIQSLENPTKIFTEQYAQVMKTAKRFMDNFPDYIGPRLTAQCVSNSVFDVTTTPLDVVAVLMSPSHPDVRNIVSKMASKLHLNKRGSTLSLLGVGVRGFKELTGPSVAACSVLRAETAEDDTPKDGLDVLNELRMFLHQLHTSYNESLSRNGTVVVFFDFAGTLQNGSPMDRMMKQMRSIYSEAKFLAVGQQENVLNFYVRLPKDSLVLNSDLDSFVLDKLLPAVASSPAEFQVPTCNSRDPQNAGPIKLTMLPERKQMWELSSSYFHRSTKPQITFTVISGTLKICQNNPCGNVVGIDAYESKSAKDRVVSFNLTDPCKEYRDHHSCPNMKFILESSRVAADANLAKSCFKDQNSGPGCQTLVDVEFEVSFKGMHCGCGSLFCSPLLLLVGFLLSVAFRQYDN